MSVLNDNREYLVANERVMLARVRFSFVPRVAVSLNGPICSEVSGDT